MIPPRTRRRLRLAALGMGVRWTQRAHEPLWRRIASLWECARWLWARRRAYEVHSA